MAQPKEKMTIKFIEVGHFEVWVNEAENYLEVWVDEAENYLDDVLSIPGVHTATAKGTRINIFIDRKYDIDKIVSEVKQLLSVEIP